MSLALPIAPRRRGACPTLDAPMQTGDGLLARVRIAGGRLTPDQLAGIAMAARQHGNGQIEITARGNLQVRGLTFSSQTTFAQVIHAIAEIETGLVVETPPLAGDDPTELADPRPLAQAIRRGSMAIQHRLGPKVTVVVDVGGQLNLAALKADIRLTALNHGWQLSVGGSAPRLEPAPVENALLALARLAELGPDARGIDLVSRDAPTQSIEAKSPIGHFRTRSSYAVGIALPFGAASSEALHGLAAAAARHQVSTLALAPHHGLLAFDAPDEFVQDTGQLGFITDTADPRLRISACIGSAGCASGFMPARTLAARLASIKVQGHLHVSGCAKGCAHPRPAALTLVGRADGYGLVIGGRAGDTPAMILQDDQIESAIARAGQPQ